VSTKAYEMSDFRGRLQQAAQHAGVGDSQATMAASLNLNRQTINRWFQGGEPNAEMLLHIARTWGVDAEWLKSGDGEMLPTPSPDDLPSDELELLRDYRKASQQTRQQIRTMVRALRKSVVLIAAGIPPLLLPAPTDAATLHNRFSELNTHCMRRWLRALTGALGFMALAACSSIKPMDEIPQHGTFTRSVTWVMTDDPAAVCDKEFGKPLIGNRTACAKLKGNDCTVYVKPPRSESDRQAMYVLGHEVLHCFVGHFHYAIN
jgi:transcriptional regulator with XRE-family HTH domain